MRTSNLALRRRATRPTSLSELRTEFAADERGSLTIFSLFLFVLILLIAGLAVDLARFESERVAVQNTLDSAILSASSLSQEADAETLVKDYFAKAGLDPDGVTVVETQQLTGDGTGLVGRSVTASAPISMNTLFMSMMGIDELNGGSLGGAKEAVQNIEISLIVDISGSMGRNSRLTNLKVAAKEFVDVVMTDNPSADYTSISIIPYNATVVVGDEILSRLNAGGSVVQIDPVPSYPGALETYRTEHTHSTCVRFEDDDFYTRAIGSTTPLTRVSHFAEGGNWYSKPSMSDRWCNENRSSILPFSNDPAVLKAYIDGLTSGGYTGIDNGMKWGVALLDPAFAPVTTAMVDDSLLSENVRGRPGRYDNAATLKYVVLMTDGDNTVQRDLDTEFKAGPSRVWYAESRTSGYDDALDRNLTSYDGYFVEMPNNGDSDRWYVPGRPTTTDDDYYTDTASLPADAQQLDYIELYDRFSVLDIARFFFRQSDPAAEDAHEGAVVQTEGYASIDTRLSDICTAAKEGNRITVFAIGFEAPTRGQDAMRDCASSLGHYFDVEGTEISDAFKSIASQITMLRLTE